MSFKDAAQAIESRLQANWSATPIKFENVPFQETTTAYVALSIRDGEGNQISLGTPALRRWPGVIIVQILVPEDSGIRIARGHADGIGAIFDRAQFSAANSGFVSCATPSIQMIGVRNGWLQVNVTVPYQRSRQY